MPAVSNSSATVMDAERFLSTTISILATSQDFRTAIENLGRLATARLAEWCAVFTFENEQVRRLAVITRSHPANSSPQVEMLYPLKLHAPGPASVLRTGEPQLITDVTEEIAESLGLKPEELVMPGGGRPSSYLCVPLTARGRTIGAMAFMTEHSGRSFDEHSVELAQNLASAAAVVADNARLYRQAQEANRLKDEFIAMVSHELRTPLTPILGCVHLLRTAKLSETNFARALEMIERNAQAQVQIVEDLLDVSRIVAGKLHLAMKSTPLLPVLEAAVDSVRPAAAAKGVEIFAKFQDIPEPIDGDPDRLRQVVWNLLSNAVKFTPSAGRIEIASERNNDHVIIRVTDTGMGIPANFLPFIFDRFRQAGDADTKMRSGLGLGLAIVRHLVELHNGSIEASSPGPGQGAVFTLKFPIAARKAAAKT